MVALSEFLGRLGVSRVTRRQRESHVATSLATAPCTTTASPAWGPLLCACLGLTLGCRDATARPSVDAGVPPRDAHPTDDGGWPPGPCTNTPDDVVITELARSAPGESTLGVIAYRVDYPSPDGTRVQGQICVPDAPGPHPILVYNRGGVTGLGVGEWGPRVGNLCHGTAAGGVIHVASQFRGTRDQGSNSLLGPIDFASEGTVEFCSGEVDDSLALMRIAQRRCDADPERVAMWGVSHGGCVTMLAASRRPVGLRAAVGVVTPTDLITTYEHNAARGPGGTVAPAAGCDRVVDHQLLTDRFTESFDTPEANAAGYAMRSAIRQARALATIPLMMVYGADDCVVPVASQGCTMRDALVAEGAPVTALHLDGSGQVITTTVAGCPNVTFEPEWPSRFVGNHYLIIGDGQGHGLEGPGADREFDAVRSFFTAHAQP